ncbi:U1 snRNA 3'-end processing [Fragilaria crotonensis]|nr:U1 snRNA 3'-end processing [Fragilaria crotonensis]
MSTTASISDITPIIVAAVECGGTSFVVAVADLSAGTVNIVISKEVLTSEDNPHQTLLECASFFEQNKPDGGYHALGIASFGPVGVNDKKSATYGRILPTTPKAAWRNVNLVDPLSQACQGSKRSLKIKIDTDVNAPALAEFLQAVTQEEISSLAYITCGTGVGRVTHSRDTRGGTSTSPFLGVHTVEGIASSVALTERLQQIQGSDGLNRSVLSELPDDHELWDHAANALANLCVTLLLTVSIEKIVLGGGVLKRRGLIEKIRNRTVVLLNGYLELPDDMSTLICSPHYGDTAGLMGAIILAKQTLDD